MQQFTNILVTMGHALTRLRSLPSVSIMMLFTFHNARILFDDNDNMVFADTSLSSVACPWFLELTVFSSTGRRSSAPSSSSCC